MKTCGNTVLITGGASSIGSSIAKAFLDSDNRVIVLEQSEERAAAVKATHPRIEAVLCDITDDRSIRRALDGLADSELNILVNAAGVGGPSRFGEEDRALHLARLELNPNLLGTMMVTKIALPYLLARRRSAIMTISSGIKHASRLDEPRRGAANVALHAFSRGLRAELAETSVRVFEVMPRVADDLLVGTYGAKTVTSAEVARAVIDGLAGDRYEIRVGRMADGKRSAAYPRTVSREITA